MDKHPRDKVIISAQIPTDTREQLLRQAAEGHRSLSAEIRRAVTAYVETEMEKEKR